MSDTNLLNQRLQRRLKQRLELHLRTRLRAIAQYLIPKDKKSLLDALGVSVDDAVTVLRSLCSASDRGASPAYYNIDTGRGFQAHYAWLQLERLRPLHAQWRIAVCGL